MSRLFSISKLGLFFGIPFFLFPLESCVKDNRDVVPYVYLNLSLGLSTDLAQLGIMESATIIPDKNGIGVIRFSNPKYPEISLGIGQIINGNGLIIYRSDIYEYEVYDITCTFQAQTDYCCLDRNPDFDLVYDCPCCNSRFLYNSDGFYAIEGPAALPLKRYAAFIQAGNLVIRN
jgi:Rieske Fe-S protein